MSLSHVVQLGHMHYSEHHITTQSYKRKFYITTTTFYFRLQLYKKLFHPSFTFPCPGGSAKRLRLDGWLFNKFNLTNRFLWGTPPLKYCFYRLSFSFHQWLPQEKVGRWRWDHILWKSTPVTHAGATLLGKLLLITLWLDDRVRGSQHCENC